MDAPASSGNALPVHLLLARGPDYAVPMTELPEAYKAYLSDKDEDVVATVKPIMLQSAADKVHGVHIVVLPHGLQAHLDDKLPFGELVEDVD